ncbi:FKBP-type peptidyl-prolyl cis-trans isomerase [Aestuariivivens sediminis]|uniref:FKBP-type peptidyl-prolyl cis-trans isomerase n=1 Tax=Aestuariivivens sediminis TaxID=2913557 RepID=UPI001F578148|nr:FKBP-type peptidyl-prolyl cis-trans isomerase [Aestuariivivens sediminis]
MKLEKLGLFIVSALLVAYSCKKDDGGSNVTPVELRDRTEQEAADNDSLQKYLNHHYYNSEMLAGLSDPSISDIVISKLEDGETLPAGHTMLKPVVDSIQVTYANTDYKIYVLKLNQGGGGKKPTFADNVRLFYEGFLFDGSVFDSASTPVDFDLVNLIPGWRKVIPTFNVSESFIELGDGTIDYVNGGLGVMFLPSGLAYFANATSGIPAYSPINFKFELVQAFVNDHDNDGIPSYLEDLNDDGEFTVNFEDLTDATDDDTDGNSIPDYFDNDDDGDGVLTINEIISKTYDNNGMGYATREEVEALPFADNEILIHVIEDGNGNYTGISVLFTDTDNDGTPDYLDSDN